MPESRKNLQCTISSSLWTSILKETKRTGESISHLVERALASELDIAHHSLFQVSTSRALVEGVFGGCLTVKDLKQHGDFGLGTYEQLDGEMIMLEGRCFRVIQNGQAIEVPDTARVPFATITRFTADLQASLQSVDSFQQLEHALSQLRPSGNLFVGFKIRGQFSQLSLRAACKAKDGENLVSAVEHQSVFEGKNCTGTLVGFWSPPYSAAISVPGYHFHFLDDNREFGGHVFDLIATNLRVELHFESDIHVALPETEEFLRADLVNDGSESLRTAETGDTKQN